MAQENSMQEEEGGPVFERRKRYGMKQQYLSNAIAFTTATTLVAPSTRGAIGTALNNDQES
ncbi:hypothetical protein N7470_003239 [Penicillium chermesinum]|nr:hypothetical protein N7470_003239 [Penicillium chermesinum]